MLTLTSTPVKTSTRNSSVTEQRRRANWGASITDRHKARKCGADHGTQASHGVLRGSSVDRRHLGRPGDRHSPSDVASRSSDCDSVAPDHDVSDNIIEAPRFDGQIRETAAADRVGS
ncbi:hypothetical protein GCM10028790_05420 [Micromonospora taraxaci]